MTNPPYPDYHHPPPRPRYSLRAVLALAFGISSLAPLLWMKSVFVCPTPFTALLVLTFGIMTFHQSYAGDPRFRGRWMAALGILLGSITLLILAITIIRILLHLN